MATIKDIAGQLGISISTVSYALNGGPRKVPEDVRDRVLQLARDLNYRPNRLARSLVTGRAGVYGVIVGQNADERLMHEMLGTARTMGQDMMILAADENPQRAAMAALDGRLDGVLILGETSLSDLLEEQRFPLVRINLAGIESDIRLDSLAAFRDAMEHLEHLGHVRFAAIGPSVAEIEELEERVHTRGLDIPSELIFEGPATLETGLNAGRKIAAMNSRPTAILAGSDECASGVMQALRESQIEAPRDYSIVGCGDTEWSQATVPPLTTMRIPYAVLARAALEMLIAQIADNEPRQPSVSASELVIRGSTARPTRAAVTLKRFDRERLRGL
ncbi:MAG TPA: LacI family DNA-binding transcriptional regulator [Fimbriimonas sp.]|nr:LacI family DNA-binding transcriptional regulator [Fimbriimonas sp.]